MQASAFRDVVDPATVSEYRAKGFWSDSTIGMAVSAHAAERPDRSAYISDLGESSWRELDDATTRLAGGLVAAGLAPGDRIAIWLPDGPLVHVAFLAAEKAGATIVGLGARAGERELAHLTRRTGAGFFLSGPAQNGRPTAPLVSSLRAEGTPLRHLIVSGVTAALDFEIRLDGRDLEPARLGLEDWEERRIRANDLYLINSTSGTTGLPKCVLHTQSRWQYFHQRAVAHGALSADDVFLAGVPAPFGFGLWTSHVTPILLGAPTVLVERFDPEAALAAIEQHRASVLCCVSTQFIMMLASPALQKRDLSSLRVMFTGGEAVPCERAREFERITGVTILQFYGSNETGLLCGTTLEDPPERRLRTAGRIVPEMQVRLFEGELDVTASGRGQPACKGPATSLGYLEDDAANAELFTSDGWMRMGDLCQIDAEGYLEVVGRISDFIIRGGKNISAPQVEADVATHPAVAHAAVVAMPDPVFGERVCAYVELVEGADLTLQALIDHLSAHGVSKELYPERLIVLDELPRSSGEKIAKGELRRDIERRLSR